MLQRAACLPGACLTRPHCGTRCHLQGMENASDPAVADRLRSVLLHHIVPSAAGQLAAGPLVTALDGASPLQVAKGGHGGLIVTDATGASARVVGGPVEACGATYYLVDQVCCCPDAAAPADGALVLTKAAAAPPRHAPCIPGLPRRCCRLTWRPSTAPVLTTSLRGCWG